MVFLVSQGHGHLSLLSRYRIFLLLVSLMHHTRQLSAELSLEGASLYRRETSCFLLDSRQLLDPRPTEKLWNILGNIASKNFQRCDILTKETRFINMFKFENLY